MRNRLLLAGLALAVTLTPAALAGKQRMSLTLEWTPNPNHVGFYYARDTGLFAKAGLDVTIRAPSDPTAPLKLVAVGKSERLQVFGSDYETSRPSCPGRSTRSWRSNPASNRSPT